MALGAAIYKANINLSNLNTHYYDDFSLTLARHPSENESRLMFRLAVFLFCAHEKLEFTKGISTTEEPDIWQKDYSGDIIQWIELGQPDLKRLKQSCGKAKSVKVFTYNPNTASEWFQKIKDSISSLDHLEIYHLSMPDKDSLEELISKTMNLSCLIEEQSLYLSNDQKRIQLSVVKAN